MDFLAHGLAYLLCIWLVAPTAVRDSPTRVLALVALGLVLSLISARAGVLTAEIVVSLVVVPLAIAAGLVLWCRVTYLRAFLVALAIGVASVLVAVLFARFGGRAA